MNIASIWVVVLNWRQPEETKYCLASLVEQTYPKLSIVVVDNGSGDNSIPVIQTAFPEIPILANESNLGFAGGMNRGMFHALQNGADFVFLVNNDTKIAPDAVELLYETVSGTDGMLAPAIYYMADPKRIWSVGGGINKWNLEVVEKKRSQVDKGNFPPVIECEFVPGCAMFVPKETIQEVGGLDEAFFMYYEDSDWCWRIRQAGKDIRTVMAAKVWHQVALSSGGSDSVNERYWMARSSLRFFAKHAVWYQLPVIFLWRMGSALRTTMRLIANCRFEALRAYWRGLFDGLRDRWH